MTTTSSDISGPGVTGEGPRHTRQIMLREIGGPGQAKLRDARVAVVGCGGLGGPAALNLAAAGVEYLSLFDDDMVEESNLQRQIQFTEADIGAPKAEALAARLRALDGGLSVAAHATRIGADNADDLLSGHDVILDATDSFASRFAVNAASQALGLPLVSGAAAGWSAQVGVFGAEGSAPCYRCFVPEMPPAALDCETVGIVGAVVATAGSLMALEAIKLVTGAGEPLSGRLWIWDGLAAASRVISVPRDPACPHHGKRADG